MRALRAWAMLAALAAASGARADGTAPPVPCQLGRAASLDTVTTAEGMIAVRGSVNGHDENFLIDTGGVGGTLGFASAFQSRLTPQRAAMSDRFVGGTTLDYGANVARFAVGPLSYPNMWFSIAPDRMLPADLVGSIQPHIWNDLDVEIDFLNGKLNMFLEKQCPGHVVYWTHDAFAAVPMKVYPGGHISVMATLDGKPIEAFIDSGAQRSTMSLTMARTLLGIDEKNPALKQLGTTSINYLVPAKTYRYPFQTVNLEGISIRNPDVLIVDTGPDAHEPPFILGIGALRQLHLFIAYDEKVLYLTAAEAH